MNIRQLETFIAVSKCGSFSQAAEILRSTTSTVSMRIKELETALGVTLFERSKHGVRLTAIGRELGSYAAKASSAFEDIRAIVGQKDAYTGTVRLGVGEMVAVTWLPDLIQLIQLQFPKLSLELSVDLTLPLVNRLRRDDLDLALIPGTNFDAALEAHSLGQVEFSWMEGGDSNLGSGIVDQEALRRSRILSYGKDSFHYQTILNWLGEDRHKTLIDFFSNMEVIVSLIKSGMGIGIVPINRYRSELEMGNLRRLNMWQPLPPVTFSAVHRASEPSKIAMLISELAQRASNF